MNDYFDDHICTNCGYQGPAKSIDTCPECGARMMSMKDLGRYDEDEALGLAETDDGAPKGPNDDIESLEDLRDNEDEDDEDSY